MSHLSITSIYLMEKYVFLMILLEKNIFLKICHTIASGTDLRKTPLLALQASCFKYWKEGNEK